MSSLLELREKLKSIYAKNEVFIVPVLKFVLAFITFSMINGKLGYMAQIDNVAVTLIAALLCSFLPNGFLLLFAALFSLMHMYALSVEVALVGLCVYLVMFLLFFRFSPKESLVVIATPILCILKIPYVAPVAMGLIGGPASAVSIGCGLVIYFLMDTVSLNATTIGTMDKAEAVAKLRLIIDGLLNNKTMVVMIAAFVITVIVVYLLRRMSVDYSWTIAMIAGVMLNIVILLVGDLLYDTNMSVINAVLGSLLALAVAKVLEFFRFCVDYSRTEKVQFEDDEYYYYVKAIPKMTVAAPTKTVKKINTQRRPPSQVQKSGAGASSREGNRGRTVVTERTYAGGLGNSSQSKGYRNDRMNGGRSVTVGSGPAGGNETDYEDLD